MAAGWDPPLCKNIKIKKQNYKNQRYVFVSNGVHIFGIQETSTIYKYYFFADHPAQDRE